jgi:hypothetical protein
LEKYSQKINSLGRTWMKTERNHQKYRKITDFRSEFDLLNFFRTSRFELQELTENFSSRLLVRSLRFHKQGKVSNTDQYLS